MNPSLFIRYQTFFQLVLFIIFGASITSSCVSDDIIISEVTPHTKDFLSRGSNPSSIIDNSIAEYVANKFMNAIIIGNQSLTYKSVSNTVTLFNDNGFPVIYAVNFGNNEGFIMVSASKKVNPIIISSDNGSYPSSISSSPFFSRLISHATNSITESFNYPDDSLTIHEGLWSALLPPSKHSSERVSAVSTTDTDYTDIIDSIVREWENSGYEVYNTKSWIDNFSGNNKYLPGLEDILRPMTIPVNWANNLPMNQLSFILVRHTPIVSTSAEKCNPITTLWDIGAPYNASVPNEMPLSSEAVAIGKILHYFNHPLIFDYSASSSSPLDTDTEIANFLYSVALKINTFFSPTYSYATYGSLLTALSDYGYSFKTGEFTQQSLTNSIDCGSPSIVTEYDKNGRSNTWVCDGYRIVSDCIDYFLMVPVGQPDDPFGPYEVAGQWDDSGSANFQIKKSGENIYFNTFWDNNELYQSQPVFIDRFVWDRPNDNKLSHK